MKRLAPLYNRICTRTLITYFVILILIVFGASADSGTYSSIIGLSCICIYGIFLMVRRPGKCATDLKYLISLLAVLLSMVIYGVAINGKIAFTMPLLIGTLLVLALSGILHKESKFEVSCVCTTLLALGFIQYISHYLAGIDICFFSYQCELVDRLNFYNNNYRSNSLLFEPGDICTTLVLLSPSFESKKKELMVDLAAIIITLSASGILLLAAKSFTLNRLHYIHYLKGIWGKLFGHARIQKITIALAAVLFLVLYRVFIYLAAKGFGNIELDSAFTARQEVIDFILQNFNLATIVFGSGFTAYESVRLLDSIAPVISLLVSMGIAGIILSVSLLSNLAGIEWALVLLLSRWSPSSSLLMICIYLISEMRKTSSS